MNLYYQFTDYRTENPQAVSKRIERHEGIWDITLAWNVKGERKHTPYACLSCSQVPIPLSICPLAPYRVNLSTSLSFMTDLGVCEYALLFAVCVCVSVCVHFMCMYFKCVCIYAWVHFVCLCDGALSRREARFISVTYSVHQQSQGSQHFLCLLSMTQPQAH
jgi:hypothetical protein